MNIFSFYMLSLQSKVKKSLYLIGFLVFPLLAQEESLEKQKENFLTNRSLIEVGRGDVKLKLGAQVRFHYNYIQINSGEGEDKSSRTGSQFVWDIFALNMVASYKSFFMNMQYRFYASFNGGIMPAWAYIGYNFNPHHRFELGLLPKVFGGSTYHGWANTAMMAPGLEDGGGLGFQYTFNKSHYEIDVMFFKNNFSRALSGELNRFFPSPVGDESDNLLDFRFLYHFDKDRKKIANIGFSAEFGGLINARKNREQWNGDKSIEIWSNDTQTNKDKNSSRYGAYGYSFAAAIHGEVNPIEHLNIRAQYAYFEFHTVNSSYVLIDGKRYSNVIALGSNGFAYLMYPRGHIGFLGLGYDFLINKGVLEKIELFNDLALLTKGNTLSNSTITNTLGANIHMGAFILRPEWMLGKNHWWFGGDPEVSLLAGNPKPSAIDHRFNIHIGFYF